MHDAKITVLLPTFNRREYLPRALEDLKAQTFRDWRCVVVNDGGEPVGDLVVAAADPRFELHEREHLGKAAQMNWAMGGVATKYVAYADDDDEIYANHLETLYRTAEDSGREIACTRMKTTILGPDGEVVGEQPPSSAPITFETLRYCQNRCGAAQLTTIHTKSLAERAGGYDEAMRVFIDYDFIRRMVRLEEPAVADVVTANHLLRRKRGEGGDLASISGLWWRDPEEAGRSLIRFFEKDPAALTRLYLDAGEWRAAKERLEGIEKSRSWRFATSLRKLLHLLRG